MDINFKEALNQLEIEKGIAKEVILGAIRSALISAFRKNVSKYENIRIEMDPDTGKIKVISIKKIVKENPEHSGEILLEDALKIRHDAVVDTEIEIEITDEKSGRIAAQTAKQVIYQRIKDAERDLIFNEYQNKIGNMLMGTIRRINRNRDNRDNREIIVEMELKNAEAVIPYEDQIPGEHFRVGNRIKAIVKRIDQTNKGPRIELSRTCPEFLKSLFETEIPEIADGIIEIKAISREAGRRSKIAVYSSNTRIDPVGACVGMKGSRIHVIVNEINREKIDIIRWNEDLSIFITQALAPARVITMKIKKEDDKVSADVVVPDHQFSIAIGGQGQNVRLASKLTNCNINIINESSYREEMDNMLVLKPKLENIEEEANENEIDENNDIEEVTEIKEENTKEQENSEVNEDNKIVENTEEITE